MVIVGYCGIPSRMERTLGNQSLDTKLLKPQSSNTDRETSYQTANAILEVEMPFPIHDSHDSVSDKTLGG
jgi:hypothetical protein